MPDLYGKKAWLVIGLATAGWALVVIFMYALLLNEPIITGQSLNATVNALGMFNQIMGRFINTMGG